MTITDACPSGLPHVAFIDDAAKNIAPGSVTVNESTAVHPLESVMVTLYCPAQSPIAVAVD